MRQDAAKAFLPLLAAWAAGETIQGKYEDGVWRDVLSNCAFSRPPDCYRVKPKEPRTFYMIEYQNKPDAVRAVVYMDKATALQQDEIFTKLGYQTKLTVVKEVSE